MADIHNIDIAGHRDDELICRFLDNELSTEEVARVEQRLASDSAFSDRIAHFRRNDQKLKALHDDIDVTLPPALIAKLADKAPTKREFRRAPWLAVAASLTMAIGVGLALEVSTIDGDHTPRMTRTLSAALEVNPSRADGWDPLADGTELRAVLTFPAADGNWCREFLLASDEGHWRGVACREQNTWVTQVIGREVFLDQQSGYRPAGAGDNDQVARFIDETASDVALSAGQEQSLIAAGWKQ